MNIIIANHTLFLAATNECSLDGITSPCNNGGVCVDLVRSYHCICSGSYQGPHCMDMIKGIIKSSNALLSATSIVVVEMVHTRVMSQLITNTVWVALS